MRRRFRRYDRDSLPSPLLPRHPKGPWLDPKERSGRVTSGEGSMSLGRFQRIPSKNPTSWVLLRSWLVVLQSLLKWAAANRPPILNLGIIFPSHLLSVVTEVVRLGYVGKDNMMNRAGGEVNWGPRKESERHIITILRVPVTSLSFESSCPLRSRLWHGGYRGKRIISWIYFLCSYHPVPSAGGLIALGSSPLSQRSHSSP